MNSYVRKDVGLGTGMKTIQHNENDDDSDTRSSSASENTSEDDDEDGTSSEFEGSSNNDPFMNGTDTESNKDADTSICNREASVDYSKNVALTNWTGRCSIPYSVPLLVNSVSSTTQNFPNMDDIKKKFQSAVNPSQFIQNPNLLFCSPLKRELPNDAKMFTSTPKKPRFEADQSNLKIASEPIRHFQSISSTTNCHNPSPVTQTVVRINPHSSSLVSSSAPNASFSSTPGTFTRIMQGGSDPVKVVRSVQTPACPNVVVLKPSTSQGTVESFVSIFLETTEILTTEILRKIFKMCSLDDRKNIRLVCKDWFNVCSIFEVEEKICVPRFYNDHLTTVMSTLYQSKRRCFNFEFYGLDFGRKPRVTFWKICGPKVVSMKLFDCKISSPAFANILKHCHNLQILEFDFYRFRELRNGIRLNSSRHMIEADSSNRSLRTLKINSRVASLDDSSAYWLNWVCQFFRLFPNISNFSLGQNCWNKMNKDMPPCAIDTYKVLLNKYFSRPRLESIALNIYNHSGLSWNNLTSVEGLTKITEIAVDFDQNMDLKSFSDFLLHQANLRKFTLYSFEEKDSKQKLDCFVPMIVRRSSLREFNLFMSNTVVEWDYRWSALFNSSNMEALRIICLAVDFSSDVPDRYSLPINSKLTTLAIRVENPYNMHIIALLDSFQHLEKLYLSYMSQEIMNALCKRQHKIKSLTVNRTLSNVVCRLKKLEKLEIPETVTLEGECLYNLKHLRVLRPTVLLSEEKDFVPRNYLDLGSLQAYKCFCPSLNTLWIDCVLSKVFCGNIGQLFQLIDGLLDRMRGLKFLYFAHNVFMTYAYQPRLTEKDVALIFEKYDSLRVFVYRDVFVKDVIVEEGSVDRIRKLETDQRGKGEMLKKYMKDGEEWDYQYEALNPLTYY